MRDASVAPFDDLPLFADFPYPCAWVWKDGWREGEMEGCWTAKLIILILRPWHSAGGAALGLSCAAY